MRGLLTKDEVAGFFQVSDRQISYWMDAGDIDYIKLGKSLRFSPKAVSELAERRTIKRKI